MGEVVMSREGVGMEKMSSVMSESRWERGGGSPAPSVAGRSWRAMVSRIIGRCVGMSVCPSTCFCMSLCLVVTALVRFSRFFVFPVRLHARVSVMRCVRLHRWLVCCTWTGVPGRAHAVSVDCISRSVACGSSIALCAARPCTSEVLWFT